MFMEATARGPSQPCHGAHPPGKEPKVKAWIRGLTIAGNVIGAIVILYGVAVYLTVGAVIGLLIAVAVLVVGPGEDLLEDWARRTAETPEQGELRVAIVDRSTSLAFLVLLGIGIYLL